MQISYLSWFVALVATCSLATTKSSSMFLNFRLPNETYPEHYDIKLTTNVHMGIKAFQGEVIIDIVIAEATSNIVLHARQIEISNVTIVNPSSGESESLSHEYELKREFLTLQRQRNQKFAAETKWKLYIFYNGELIDRNKGFFWSIYTNYVGQVRYFAATHFESTNARQALPCYDEPDKRANFTITIKHSPTYTAISNMPVNENLSRPGQTVFLTTARIPTYIVAFVVSDFQHTERASNGFIQRIYSRSSEKTNNEWALASSVLIEEHLSKYYGIKLLLPLMSHVALPSFTPGTTQNLGLAIYNENKLLCNMDRSTVLEKTSITKAIAYEFSHQWFGGYVTSKWWSYLWLNKGFATLFSYKALDSTHPKWGVWQEFHIVDYQNALETDDTYYPRAMNSYVQTPKEIESLYDSVSSSKASSVLHMWNNALTEKIFRKSLQTFLTKNQYSSVSEEDFFTAIQNVVEITKYKIPATINQMMSSWTNQGGYPLLMVIRNYENGTFIVWQETYNNDETFQNGKTWYVPINYAVASNPNFHNTEASHYLLNVFQTKFDDVKIGKEDWLILNKQSTGFYRINYDAKNWNLIVKGLIEKPCKIHLRNRAQLMQDAYHLIITNRLDHAILLKMLTYLKQEDQYTPWSTAYKILNEYNRYLSGSKYYDDFQSFVAEHVKPIYKKLGVNEIPGEPYYNKRTRSLVINLACRIGIKECLEETNSKLKTLIRENKLIERNLEESIYCNGVRQSGDEEFNFLFQKLLNSTDEKSRSSLISYLGCSQNKNHIRKYIYNSVADSSVLRPEERSSLLRSVYQRSEMGLLACIQFLKRNWFTYGFLSSQNGGSYPLDDDIRGMASYVVNKNQEEKLLALVAQVKNGPHVKGSLETDVRNKMDDNFLWLTYHGKPIVEWIAQYIYGNGNGDSTSITT